MHSIHKLTTTTNCSFRKDIQTLEKRGHLRPFIGQNNGGFLICRKFRQILVPTFSFFLLLLSSSSGVIFLQSIFQFNAKVLLIIFSNLMQRSNFSEFFSNIMQNILKLIYCGSYLVKIRLFWK